jgi:hypothetical protein
MSLFLISDECQRFLTNGCGVQEPLPMELAEELTKEGLSVNITMTAEQVTAVLILLLSFFF